MEKKELAQINDLMFYSQATSKLTTAEKAGQLFMPAAFINDTEEEIRELEKLIQDHAIGGLCFFHSRASAATNYEEKEEVIYNGKSFDTLKALIERYQNVAKYPLLISIDAEWGLAMRVENTPQYPYAICLGAIQNGTDLIFQMGQNIAKDCRHAGIHWNLAPVVDINNNPDNPVIGYRSFGDDKQLVAEKAMAFVKGMQAGGLLTSVKHFPGHGDTATDSHLGLPLINKTREELVANELYPFQRLIDMGVESVMVGHLSVPALAAGSTISSSISKAIIKDILRKEMGFSGVVVSDALNMHAVSRDYTTKGTLEWLAFDAGNDILCFAEHTAEGIRTILKNASEEQIEESFKRVWGLKERVYTRSPDKLENPIDPKELNRRFAEQSLTQFLGAPNILEQFKSQDFFGVQIGAEPGKQFFDSIERKLPFNSFSGAGSDLEKINVRMKITNNVLLAVFPPKVKPLNNFGITDAELAFIDELLVSKNVALYLFGNPYFLNLIKGEKAKLIVIAYQDFGVYQEYAAQHFLGEVQAKGVLPVTLNTTIS